MVPMLAAGLMLGFLAEPAPANATCASFFGIGNTAECTSVPGSIAMAIGANAVASARGVFGFALAVGTNATAGTDDFLTTAITFGNRALAAASGVVGFALQIGDYGYVYASGPATAPHGLGFNTAISFSPYNQTLGGSFVHAHGIGNTALNLNGSSSTPGGHNVLAEGLFNNASNIGGDDNHIVAVGRGNSAFNVFGNHNGVAANPGPLAVAGAVFQNQAVINRERTGININGTTSGGSKKPRGTKSSTGARSPR
jgi:hypothetical protein